MVGDQNLLKSLLSKKLHELPKTNRFLEAPTSPTLFPLNKMLKANENKQNTKERNSRKLLRIKWIAILNYCSKMPKGKSAANEEHFQKYTVGTIQQIYINLESYRLLRGQMICY